MKLHSSGFLGLALGDRSILCAEVSASGDRRTVRRTATFTPPLDASFDKADAMGRLLAAFLRQQRFRASRAVVGVPARWLIATERQIPPTGGEQLAALLRLQAERLSVSESGEMVFDYTGRVDASQGGKVMLVGILREQLQRIDLLMDAAGVSVVAVTPTSLALASAMQHERDRPLLVLGRQHAELVLQHNETPRLLRHFALTTVNGDSTPALAPLSSELRRSMALAPTGDGGRTDEMLLCDGIGLSQSQISELSNRLDMPVRADEGLRLLGVQAERDTAMSGETGGPGLFAPALALALTGVQRRTLPLDLKHSRLAPPRRRSFNRRFVWAIVLAAVGVTAIASLYWNVHRRQDELKHLRSQLDTMAPDIKSAEQMLAHVSYANGYFGARPPILDCLREITLAFRDDQPIWVTNFTLRENGKGQLTGKATDQKTILMLCDRLQKTPRFMDVRTLQMTEVNVAGGRSKEQSFTIAFTFVGME
ncbi:MAG: hypothetical protein KA354_02025 [Phycisphaerae bacterium]|nr:hypothetical protein [Phycisphaerae bacterium]